MVLSFEWVYPLVMSSDETNRGKEVGSPNLFRQISAWFMGLLKHSFHIPNFQIYPANNLEVGANGHAALAMRRSWEPCDAARELACGGGLYWERGRALAMWRS